MRPFSAPPPPRPLLPDPPTLDTNPGRALQKSLQKLQNAIDDLAEPHRAGYRRACAFLQEATTRWPMGYPNGGFIAWPVNIDETFLSCLKDGHWMARMVFLHYGVGMHLLSENWYVGDWGRRMVAAVLQGAEDIPSTWADTIAWTQQAVGLDIEVDTN